MQKNVRTILTESIWVVLSFGLTLLMILLFFGSAWLKTGTTILIYDTYYVVDRWSMIITLFFGVTFVFYFGKELRKSFSRSVPNFILIISGLGVMATLGFLIKFLSSFSAGWISYPPLSRLAFDNNSQDNFRPDKLIVNISLAIQILFLILLLYVVYRWVVATRKQRKA
jgi:hypothetical protein